MCTDGLDREDEEGEIRVSGGLVRVVILVNS